MQAFILLQRWCLVTPGWFWWSSLRVFICLGFGSAEEPKDIVMYIPPSKRNQDPAPRLHYCFFTAPPWSLHPILPWLATCPLELRKGPGGWSLFLKNKKWGVQKGLCPGVSQVPAQFHREGPLWKERRHRGTLGLEYCRQRCNQVRFLLLLFVWTP